MRNIIICLCAALALTSCTVYTEKRSEALSQAVFATADSVDAARFDLADSYSKEATKLANPPKVRVKIDPIYTKGVKHPKQKTVLPTTPTVSSAKADIIDEDCSGSAPIDKPVYLECSSKFFHRNAAPTPTPVPVPKVSVNVDNEENVLRLVVPEKFRDAELLIEGSSEWTDLLQTKEFYKKLQVDHANLQKVTDSVNAEVVKQKQMSDKMVIALNELQKKCIAKDLRILQLTVALVSFGLFFLLCAYLRIKGVF